jgi:hypothetical protein
MLTTCESINSDIYLENANKTLGPSVWNNDRVTFRLLTEYHLVISTLRKAIPGFETHFDKYKYPNINPVLKILSEY